MRARELLATTDLTVGSGGRPQRLGSGESLRRHLSRHSGTTPATYRGAFPHRPREHWSMTVLTVPVPGSGE
ncbi:hypothetical protein ACFW9D_00350 [Streptomyces sp. NPDC059524]|uniref:hypothetical protein n=1 Tax=Streptomyces sp. NPDC059524 TaxID=3346856 RepID=UPI0036D04A9D